MRRGRPSLPPSAGGSLASGRTRGRGTAGRAPGGAGPRRIRGTSWARAAPLPLTGSCSERAALLSAVAVMGNGSRARLCFWKELEGLFLWTPRAKVWFSLCLRHGVTRHCPERPAASGSTSLHRKQEGVNYKFSARRRLHMSEDLWPEYHLCAWLSGARCF